MQFRDLKLSYMQAAHGVQTAIKYEMLQRGLDADSHKLLNYAKHLRVGIDLGKADMAGLAGLLIRKGFITEAEYLEAMRLGANEELARYNEHINTTYNVNVVFR